MRRDNRSPDGRLLDELKGRIRKRVVRGKTVLWLDLRGKAWGNLGRITLRDPSAPGWPQHGDTTDDEEVAENWLEERYLGMLGATLTVVRHGKALATVEDAARAYLDDLFAQCQGDTSHNTYATHRGRIHSHIIPDLGSKLLVELDNEAVRSWILTLKVYDHKDTRSKMAGRTRLASRGTMTGVLNTLRAIWRHHHPEKPPPWGAVDFKTLNRKEAIERARALKAGHRPIQNEHPLDQDETRHLVLTSYNREQRIWGSGPARAVSVPYLTVLVVLILCTGARISEVTWIRWQDIFWDLGAVCVPGAKSRASFAFVPLQRSLLPWLCRARRLHEEHLGKPPSKKDLIIQNNPHGYRDEPVNRNTTAPVLDGALEEAGLKLHGRAAHALRKTFSTTASAKGISDERVKQLLRHATVYGQVTDAYVRSLIGNIHESERHIMDCIPSPPDLSWDDILTLFDDGVSEEPPRWMAEVVKEAPVPSPDELAKLLKHPSEAIRSRAWELAPDTEGRVTE